MFHMLASTKSCPIDLIQVIIFEIFKIKTKMIKLIFSHSYFLRWSLQSDRSNTDKTQMLQRSPPAVNKKSSHTHSPD